MLETELKCMISAEAFERVKAAYKWNGVKTQENHYYSDTSGVLAENRTVFRIRKSGGTYKIQVKAHKNSSSPMQISEETEFDISNAPEIVSAEDGRRYTGLDTGELVKLGFNVTERYSFMPDENTELCLDKTSYFDITDYEVEVEYRGEYPSELIDGLKALGVIFENEAVGKYTRFITSLRSRLSE